MSRLRLPVEIRFVSGLCALVSLGASGLFGSRLPAGETYARPMAGFVARDLEVYDSLYEQERSVGVGGLAFSAEGYPIVYVEGTLEIHEPGGVRVLAKFDPPAYGAFAVLAPDGKSVYFAESTVADESSIYRIHRVPLHGGDSALVDQQVFAYDLAFDPEGRGYMSALTNDPHNSVVLLDEDPANVNRKVIADMPTVSGPLTFDEDGNLYYGTVDFSDNPLKQGLYKFTRDQLEASLSGDPLTLVDGELLLSEIDGFCNLRWFQGKLYFTDLGYGPSRLGALKVIDPGDNYSVDTLLSFPYEGQVISPTLFAFHPGTRPFDAGSGSAGGRLLVCYMKYMSFLRLAEVTPQLYFIRGEVNGDERVDIADPIAIVSFLFLGGRAPEDIESADSNSDGIVDVSDAVYILNFLFSGGPVIPPPYPERGPALEVPPLP